MDQNLSQAFQFIYHHNQDKQRIAMVGGHATVVFKMMAHVLKQYNKKADFISENQFDSYQSLKFTDAPVLLVNYPVPTISLKEFNFHVLIITNPLVKRDLATISLLTDSLPKSGILIADDREPATSIAIMERADVLTLLAKECGTDREGTHLITSTNEKFPIRVTGEEHLRCISAAKETLKRIGISSGQFYRAITTFAL